MFVCLFVCFFPEFVFWSLRLLASWFSKSLVHSLVDSLISAFFSPFVRSVPSFFGHSAPEGYRFVPNCTAGNIASVFGG